jgi:hypothetical protein
MSDLLSIWRPKLSRQRPYHLDRPKFLGARNGLGAAKLGAA